MQRFAILTHLSALRTFPRLGQKNLGNLKLIYPFRPLFLARAKNPLNLIII